MKKKIIFLDGDGTLWYPKKTKRTEKPHWIYHHEDTKDNYLEHLELTPKIKDTLEILKAMGIILVVISANPHAEDIAINQIIERLTHFELNDLFVSVQSSPGDNPKGKADVILKVLKELNLEKQDALMIGDSYVYDYLAAKEIGIDAFWIENPVSKLPEVLPEDLKKISEVSDILNILELKNTIYLLCGLPGSGKSSWAEKFVQENPGTVHYKFDKFFIEKFGNGLHGEKHAEYEKIIKAEILEKMKTDIANKKDVILDFGFWKKEEREEAKKLILSLGAVPKLMYFKQPREILLERLNARNSKNLAHEHLIPEVWLEEFITKFEEPKDGEGFKFVYTNN